MLTNRGLESCRCRRSVIVFLTLLILLAAISMLVSAQQVGHQAGFSVQYMLAVKEIADPIVLNLPQTGGAGTADAVDLEISTNAGEVAVRASVVDLPTDVSLEILLAQDSDNEAEWKSASHASAEIGNPVLDAEGSALCSLTMRGSLNNVMPPQGSHEARLLIEVAAETASNVLSIPLVIVIGRLQVAVSIDGSETAYVNEPVTYVANVSPEVPCELEWSFSDGGEGQIGDEATHVFAQVGEYIAHVTATCPDVGSGIAEMRTLVIYRPPTALLTTVPMGAFAELGEPVAFSAEASEPGTGDIILFEWDWSFDGDFHASGLTASTAEHTFLVPGPHTVAVRVTDENGLQDVAVLGIEVRGDNAVAWELSIPEDIAGGGGASGRLELDELIVAGQTLEEQAAGENVRVCFPFDEGFGAQTRGEAEAEAGSTPWGITAQVSDMEWIERTTENDTSPAISLGSYGHVDIPYDPALSLRAFATYSISFWLRATELTQEVAVFQQGCFDDFGVGIHVYGGHPLVGTLDSNGRSAFALSSDSLDDEEWHYVRCVRGPESIQLLVDGRASVTLPLETIQAPRGSSNRRPETHLGAALECSPFGGFLQMVCQQGEEIEISAFAATGSSHATEAPTLICRAIDGTATDWIALPTTAAPAGRSRYQLAIDSSSLAPGVYEISVEASGPRQSSLFVLILPS